MSEEIAASEEFEEKAIECLDNRDVQKAAVYALLAVSSVIREATFVVADILLIEEDEEDPPEEADD